MSGHTAEIWRLWLRRRRKKVLWWWAWALKSWRTRCNHWSLLCVIWTWLHQELAITCCWWISLLILEWTWRWHNCWTCLFLSEPVDNILEFFLMNKQWYKHIQWKLTNKLLKECVDTIAYAMLKHIWKKYKMIANPIEISSGDKNRHGLRSKSAIRSKIKLIL